MLMFYVCMFYVLDITVCMFYVVNPINVFDVFNVVDVFDVTYVTYVVLPFDLPRCIFWLLGLTIWANTSYRVASLKLLSRMPWIL